MSEDSWGRQPWNIKFGLKESKAAPNTANMAKTPFDIHDIHPDDRKKMNADGTYFDPEMGAVVMKKKPAYSKKGSTGYFGERREEEGREAHNPPVF